MRSDIDMRTKAKAASLLVGAALALALLPGIALAADVTVDGVDYETDVPSGSATCTGPFYYGGDPRLVLPDEVSDSDSARSYPVTHVRRQAFQGNTTIEHLSSPAHLVSIEASAFAENTKLVSVDLSASTGLVALGGVDGTKSSCFSSCTSLQEIRLPDGLRVIGPNMFWLCIDLTQIKLPDKLVTIGESAFEGTGLTNVTIPAGVTEVGGRAFASCARLEYITCLGSDIVPTLRDDALYHSSTLDAVYVPVGKKQAYVANGWPERLIQEVRPGRLSNLTVCEGAADYPLVPRFDPDASNQSYAVTVDEETESFTVVPTGGTPEDAITVDGVRVESGKASQLIPIAPDSVVTVKVEISGPNGGQSYAIEVTRPKASLAYMAVETQPSKMTYHAGEPLDLSGMTLRRYWSDGTSDVVTPDAVGIACEPANGVALTQADDGKRVKATFRGMTAETGTLAVNPAVVTSVHVAAQPRLAYREGEALDLSALRVSIGWSDGARIEVGSDAVGLACDPVAGTVLTAADHNRAVTATYGGLTASVGTLAVSPAELASIAVVQQPSKLSYHAGEPLDLSGLRLKLTWSDGTDTEVGYDAAGIACVPAHGLPLDIALDGSAVTVAYRDKTTQTDPLTVLPAKLVSLVVKTQPQLSYHAGEPLDLSALRVSLGWSDGTRTEVGSDAVGLACDPADGTVLTESDHGRPVVVSYDGLSARAGAVEVNPSLMKSVSVKTQPRLAYNEGEQLDLSAMELTLVWADGMVVDVRSDIVGLACDPAHGTALDALHDGRSVTVVYAGREAKTELLSVASKPAPKLAALAVETQPRLAYKAGEKLDLSGMVLSFTWDDGTVTKGGADLVSVACDPADGTVLDTSFNGKAVTVASEGLSAHTEPLSVRGGTLIPPTGDPLAPGLAAFACAALAAAGALTLTRRAR